MDLEIFHEIWDYQRYTPLSIREAAWGGTMIDIGAHIGLFSVFATRELSPSKIICVEPNPLNLELLRVNVSKNNVREVVVYPSAIAGHAGHRWITVDRKNSGGHSLFGLEGSRHRVNVMTLSELFQSNNVTKCSLLKMDCEGAEMEILDETADELLARISALCFEYHLESYDERRLWGTRDRLESIGFTTSIHPTTSTLGILYGINHSIDLERSAVDSRN